MCDGCPEYLPMGKRILFIKFGAIGDALRTTPLLRALDKLWPKPYITWVTDAASYPLLQNIPQIHRLWAYDHTVIMRVQLERWDAVLNFDKATPALCLAELAHAPWKAGFRLSSEGNLTIFNDAAEYALQLGLSDPLKFRENTKSYMQIVFEMAGLRHEGEEYCFALTDKERAWARARFAAWGITDGDTVVGLNTGAGPVFATKKWTEEGYLGLAQRLHQQHPEVKILLLGGPAEHERNVRLAAALGAAAINTGADNPIRLFAAIVNRCDLLVTGDTMALHLAIALRRRAVVYFGSTCHQEIDLYGRGETLLTDTAQFPCAPCYLKECKLAFSCMQALTVDKVYAAVERQLAELGRG